jgi:hypothetical protein
MKTICPSAKGGGAVSKVPSFENTNKPDKPDGDLTRNYCIFVTHLTYEDFKQHFEFGSVSASGSALIGVAGS